MGAVGLGVASARDRLGCRGPRGHAIRARILEPDRYRDRGGNTDSIAVDLRPDGVVDVDGCAVRWRGRGLEFLTGPTPPQPDPGPHLGRATMQSVYLGAGWLITDFHLC